SQVQIAHDAMTRIERRSRPLRAPIVLILSRCIVVCPTEHVLKEAIHTDPMHSEIVRRVQAESEVFRKEFSRGFESINVANVRVEWTHPIDLIPRCRLEHRTKRIKFIEQIERQWRAGIGSVE